GRLTRFGLPIGMLRLVRAVRRIDRVRGVLFGVLPHARGRGVETVLFARGQEAIAARGYTGGTEYGWTLEDNQAVNGYLRRLGCARSRTYRIYGRDL
ncbi:hypothetical protein AB0J43_56290, partial [Nonomuraea fuscirosea]